jgi:23S rRNA U2552 (ribose-2'-O)-methylase RlmE/FtsJ
VHPIVDKAEKYLTDNGRFVAKVFMWPWFDELIVRMKEVFGGKWTKIFKPQASRKQSKEIFIVGRKGVKKK